MRKDYESMLADIACKVWDHPEPGFCEFESTKIQTSFLKEQGFEVQENVAGTKTGYIAT